MTEAGSRKTELDLLVAFLLLFKQPRRLGHGSSSEEGPAWPQPTTLLRTLPGFCHAWGRVLVPALCREAPLGSGTSFPCSLWLHYFPLALWPAVASPPTSGMHFLNRRYSHASCLWLTSCPTGALLIPFGVCFLPLSVCLYLISLLLLYSVFSCCSFSNFLRGRQGTFIFLTYHLFFLRLQFSL